MEKLDLTKHYKSYYTAKTTPEIIDIDKARYLAISGKGDPSGVQYAHRVQALYATAYHLKFFYKAKNQDFVVAKLEGLWSFDEEKYGYPSIHEAPVKIPRSDWEYKMMIRMPDYVTRDQAMASALNVEQKKQNKLAREIEFFTMKEGKSVQILHIGPFENEPETLLLIKKFVEDNGLKKNGLHHEIYLSDFRKTGPEKLKTILREPVL